MNHRDASLRKARLASLEELVAGARAREPEATRAFVLAVGPTILSAVRRVVGARHSDVEDIAQEAVIQLLRALDGFRSECSVRHFACRVATMQALQARRQSRYRDKFTPITAAEAMEDRASEAHVAQDDALANERRRLAIRQMLDELPEAQAEAVALYFIMGFTAEEVAEATQTPVPTVRSRIRLARDALKALVQEREGLKQMLSEEEVS